MKKRVKFQCWNCPKTYSQNMEITDEQKIIVTCPFCHVEAVVDLRPYSKEVSTVLKKIGDKEQDPEEEFNLPDIFPTRKPE